MSEADIFAAIDRGGGQTCDARGVMRALIAAGYAVVPADTAAAGTAVYARGWSDARDAAAVICDMEAEANDLDGRERCDECARKIRSMVPYRDQRSGKLLP